jgi:hypothetical protein
MENQTIGALAGSVLQFLQALAGAPLGEKDRRDIFFICTLLSSIVSSFLNKVFCETVDHTRISSFFPTPDPEKPT